MPSCVLNTYWSLSLDGASVKQHHVHHRPIAYGYSTKPCVQSGCRQRIYPEVQNWVMDAGSAVPFEDGSWPEGRTKVLGRHKLADDETKNVSMIISASELEQIDKGTGHLS